MRSFLNRWISRLGRIPPRDFWPTLIHFVHYAWVQSLHAARRGVGSREIFSHLNFKRTHYLEKAILCGLPKTSELDSIYRDLKAYVEGPLGPEDDCYLYMVKMLREYEGYPASFTCYMREVAFKPHKETEAKALRRIVVQRRSIRSFSEEPVSEDLLRKVVEAGTYAPTSCNAQPLAFITVTGREMVSAIFRSATGAEAWADAVPAAVLVTSDRRHYKPFEQHIIMYQDMAAAIQNCLLASESLNLAACWVSLVSDLHINGQEHLYRRLHLPAHRAIGGVIAIGHPTNTVCHVPRRPLHRVWHHNQFGASADAVRLSSKDFAGTE